MKSEIIEEGYDAMNRHISYFFLFSYFILFLFAISKSAYGVTVPAGDIRTAVENAVREYAARQSLDFEIIVPHAQDVEIKSIAAPVIRASLVGKAIRSAATPVRVEFLDGEGSIIRIGHFLVGAENHAVLCRVVIKNICALVGIFEHTPATVGFQNDADETVFELYAAGVAVSGNPRGTGGCFSRGGRQSGHEEQRQTERSNDG